MGQSTDAILFYGFLIDEENDYPFMGDIDVEDFISEKYGLAKPDLPYDENKEFYHEHWKINTALLKSIPVDINTHCSCDYPMYYVHIKSSKTTAYRGYPKKIDSLEVGIDWDEQLQIFCNLTGIEPKEFGWYLVSLWC